MDGYIHSIETFGTVDGPGVRYVIFLQGCPLRCAYCHNPDTWTMNVGNKISPKALIQEYKRNSSFYKNGGITVTGGEPLCQLDFLIELFKMAKEEGIHTCIDTSGAIFDENDNSLLNKLDTLLKHTDLVMLDIKHIDSQKHKDITGKGNENILLFARYLEKKEIPLWVRHVVVPHLTDSPDDLIALGKFLGTLKNLKALDVLPYHTMGVSKYEKLGIKYRLSGTNALSLDEAKKAKEYILQGIKE